MAKDESIEEEYTDEKLEKLFDEIADDQRLFRRRPPKDVSSLVEFVDGTLLSYVKDLAHYAREQDTLIQDLFDRVEALADGEEPDPETQFTPEHALDFKILVTFAREQAKQILASGHEDMVEGTEAHGQAMMIVSKAEVALTLIDESTLEEDDDEEEAADDAEH